ARRHAGVRREAAQRAGDHAGGAGAGPLDRRHPGRADALRGGRPERRARRGRGGRAGAPARRRRPDGPRPPPPRPAHPGRRGRPAHPVRAGGGERAGGARRRHRPGRTGAGRARRGRAGRRLGRWRARPGARADAGHRLLHRHPGPGARPRPRARRAGLPRPGGGGARPRRAGPRRGPHRGDRPAPLVVVRPGGRHDPRRGRRRAAGRGRERVPARDPRRRARRDLPRPAVPARPAHRSPDRGGRAAPGRRRARGGAARPAVVARGAGAAAPRRPARLRARLRRRAAPRPGRERAVTELELHALLGHPDWAAVDVLAEPAGGPDGVPVRDVVTVADFRAEVTAARAALVAVALSGDREDWHLDALLRRAAAGGAAARRRRKSDQVVAALVATTASVCSATGGGVDGLVAALAQAWRRPVWLPDGHGDRLAGPEPGPTDRRALLTRPVQTGRRPTTLAAAVPPGVPAELAAVRAALGVAAGAVGQRLAENRLAVERDARLRMSLLAELLQAEPDAGTRRRALDAGRQLDGWHVGIRGDAPYTADPLVMRPEVLRAFEAAHLHALVVEQGRGWSAWTTFAEEPSAAQLHAHATAARRAQWLLRSTLPSAMGVGRLYRDATGLART